METPTPLFKEEDVKDTSSMAIKESDTTLQRMSKKYLRTHQYNGEAATHLIAYQMGAKESMDAMKKQICKTCPAHSDCINNKEYEDCNVHEAYLKLTTK
jgi:hypothetical protein